MPRRSTVSYGQGRHLLQIRLPGMPMSLFWPFAVLALYGGYKFAICAIFGYCLLDYSIGGPKAYD